MADTPLSKTGIKYTGEIEIAGLDLNGKDRKIEFAKLMAKQQQWFKKTAKLEDISHVLNGWWSQAAAPGMKHVDVQKTVQTLKSVQKSMGRNPVFFMDTETTGLSLESPFFSITDITIHKYGPLDTTESATFNAILKPSKEVERVLKDTIDKASRLEPLSPDARFALNSLIRYDVDPLEGGLVNGEIKSYSSKFKMGYPKELSHFDAEQIASMRHGLENLVKYGLDETVLEKGLTDFLNERESINMVFHNGLEFDEKAIVKMFPETWEKINKLKQVRKLDTLDIFKILSSNPALLYEKTGLDLEKALSEAPSKGLNTMDALAASLGITEEGAHSSARDARVLHDLFMKIVDPAAEMIEEGKGRELDRFGIVDALSYNERPMQVGDRFFALQGLQGTGLDFAADIIPEGSSDKGYVYNWVLSPNAEYELQGVYQEGESYIAKFQMIDRDRTVFLTGNTQKELRNKIQGSLVTMPAGKEWEGLSQELKQDYARRRVARWGSLEGSGWQGAHKFYSALNDEKIYKSMNVVEKQDFEILKPYLESKKLQMDVLFQEFSNPTVNGYLSDAEKTLVYDRYNKFLDEGFDEILRPARSWEYYVPMEGQNISLRPDRFTSRVLNELEKKVSDRAFPEQVEVTKEIEFNRWMNSLQRKMMVTEQNLATIKGMHEATLSDRIKVLGDLLRNSEKIQEMNSTVRVANLTPRLGLYGPEYLNDKARNMIQEMHDKVDAVQNGKLSEGFIKRSKALQYLGDENLSRVSKGIGSTVEALRERGLGVQLVEEGERIFAVVHKDQMDAANRTIHTLLDGGIPQNAAIIELPTLNKAGGMVYNAQTKMAGYVAKVDGSLSGIYEESLAAIRNQTDNIYWAINGSENRAVNLGNAERYAREGVNAVIERSARATNQYGYHDAMDFSLDAMENFADEARKDIVDFREVMHLEAFGGDGHTRWEDMSPQERNKAIYNLRENAKKYFASDSRSKYFTTVGLKPNQINEAKLTIGAPYEMTSLAYLYNPARPNQWQQLSHHPQVEEELRERIEEAGNKFGREMDIDTTPMLMTQKAATAAHLYSLPGKTYAAGMTVNAMQISTEDFRKLITDPKYTELRDYWGITNGDIESILKNPGTWEQSAMAMPEMRGLLEGRVPVAEYIDMSKIQSGEIALSNKVAKWLEARNNGEIPGHLELKKGDLLYTKHWYDDNNNPRSEQVHFEHETGRMVGLSQTAIKQDLHLKMEADIPLSSSEKVFLGNRKATMTPLGNNNNAYRVSAFIHDIFSQADIGGELAEKAHVLYLAEPMKHHDSVQDLLGDLETLQREYYNDFGDMERLGEDYRYIFGSGNYRRGDILRGEGYFVHSGRPLDELQGKETEDLLLRIQERTNTYESEGYSNKIVFSTSGGLIETRARKTQMVRSLVGEIPGEGITFRHQDVKAIKSLGIVTHTENEVGSVLDLIDEVRHTHQQTPEMQAIGRNLTETAKMLQHFADPKVFPESETVQFEDFKMLPAFGEPSPTIEVQHLENTILREGAGKKVQLPARIKAGSTSVDSIYIPEFNLHPNKHNQLYLSNQVKAFQKVEKAARDYKTLSVTGTSVIYANSQKAYEAMQEGISQLLAESDKAVYGAHGLSAKSYNAAPFEEAVYTRAMNMDIKMNAIENMSLGEALLSRDAAKLMFDHLEEGDDIMKGLTSEEGYMALVRRDPVQNASGYQVVRMRIDGDLEGSVIKGAAPTIAAMGGDHDGDSISAMILRMKDWGKEQVADFQERLGIIRQAQIQKQDVLNKYLVGQAKRQGKERFLSGEDLLAPYRQMNENAHVVTDMLIGEQAEERAVTASLAKSYAGLFYNTVHKIGDAAVVLHETAPQFMTAEDIDLMDLASHTFTEGATLKAKNSKKGLEEISSLYMALKSGDAERLARHTTTIESIMSKNQALLWSGATPILEKLGWNGEAETLTEEMVSAVRQGAAKQIPEIIGRVHQGLKQAGAGGFLEGGFGGTVFYGDQAYNNRRVLAEFINIENFAQEARGSFVPTEAIRESFESIGKTEAYLRAVESFQLRANRLPARETILNRIVAEKTAVSEKAVSKEIAETVIHSRTNRMLFDGIGESMQGIRGGGMLALGAAGLYIAANAFRPPADLSTNEKHAEARSGSPPAIIALNEPGSDTPQGKRIKVRAKADHQTIMEKVGSGLQEIMGKEVKIMMKDDTKAISDNWLQSLFLSALKRGRAEDDRSVE
jgi:hypothetical protein